jgi:ArsR family transcriptional regulator
MSDTNTKLFKALSDPGRLRILKMLQYRSLCVCEITSVLKLATSTVSKHLQVLKDAGFIIEEKEGKWVNYRLNSSSTDPRVISILTTLDFWIADKKNLEKDKEIVYKVDRVLLCK